MTARRAPSLQDQIETVETKLAALIRKAETGEQWAEIALIEARDLVPLQAATAQFDPFEAANVTFANNPPVDPLRRAAEALCFAAKLTSSQLNWAKSHDWFDSIVGDALIVTDSFTYEGRSYEERIIWAGTFAELRDWAGY